MELRVSLLRHTPDPEKTVAAAAKLCYSQSDAQQLDEGLTSTEVEKFLKQLLRMGHLSPVEHASFTFAIEGVSRVLTHQLVRHRLASYSQQSQRYVSESNFEYIIPPSIQGCQKAFEVFLSVMSSLQEKYDELRTLIFSQFYEENLRKGMEPAQARDRAEKSANEDARFVLPNAAETKIVVTMNARELLHFFSQRCCMRAQWEIRALADRMLELVREKAPVIFASAGPPCVSSGCPEGVMGCGESKEVRAKYLGARA